jgi:O-antigen ligase
MILFYLLVLSLPFVDHGFLAREIAGLTFEKIIGAACFLYALAYLPRRRALPALFASAQAKAFAIYVALAVTSYVLTTDEITFADFVGIFLSQFLFFITVMILVDSRERIESTVLVLVASMGILSLYLIREWIANLPEYGFSYRPGYVAGDPNMFSASALVVLPLMFYPIAHARRVWQRVGAVSCLAVTGFAFLLAASRGGFLGLICMFLWHLRSARRRIAVIAVCVLLLLVCLASPYSPLDRLLKPSESDTESSNIRLQLWAVSGKIFADHPIFGVGLWTFPKYMHQYLPPGVDLDFVVPHSTYLEAAVELGSAGLLVFLAVIAFSLRDLGRMRQAATAVRSDYFAALTGGLSTGLVGFAVAALFLSAKHAKVFWFAVFLSACLGPLMAQLLRTEREKKEALNPATPPPPELATLQPSAPAVVQVGVQTGVQIGAQAGVQPDVQPPAQPVAIPIRVGNWLTRH